MADQVQQQPPTIEAKEQALENRVSALEQALANLGDGVSPGGRQALKPYTDWRKGIVVGNSTSPAQAPSKPVA